jgi:hypothetical protein
MVTAPGDRTVSSPDLRPAFDCVNEMADSMLVSWCLPKIVGRRIQCFAPFGLTIRINPSPSYTLPVLLTCRPKGLRQGLWNGRRLSHLAVCESCLSPHTLSPRFCPTISPHNCGFAEWKSLAGRTARMEEICLIPLEEMKFSSLDPMAPKAKKTRFLFHVRS